ncbi:MAG: 2-phospho-L-lactate transferase CofD family protein [Candidatus Entotheonellia bacterium]
MNDTLLKSQMLRPKAKVKVVLFSGGRGSRVLSKELINNPQILLTIAINGYDDGASTGEVRRFLGDSLGPSDYRKNASRLASELQSCRPGLIDLFDFRFPIDCSHEEAIASFRLICGQSATVPSGVQDKLRALLSDIDAPSLEALARKLGLFESELKRRGGAFSFSDCSLGNLVFAGCFLEMGRDFNAAMADYCSLLNLPNGLIENVTDGANAYLIAIDCDNRMLGSEAEIVDANRRNHIQDIHLIDRPLTEAERTCMASAPLEAMASVLEQRRKLVAPNLRLLERIAEADLIIYAPGTQHSSLFPSYLTPGLGAAIAHNLMAIKLLITNLQEDAEIPDSSAVDLINKAVYYLREKDRLSIPTPCLITHYLINDPGRSDAEVPYIPLGRLDILEDPRLVRIGNYEEGVTGHHDAAKVLTPFVESFFKGQELQKVAVLLVDTDSLNKISQTILEMLRGGIQDLPVEEVVFYHSEDSLAPVFTESLPFKVDNIFVPAESAQQSLLNLLKERHFDYVILFESSGMYKGEDIVNLISLLIHGRLDAVWGSRRLSVNDIYQSYKLRYRQNVVLGAMSYVGSHLLSLAYLLLYGRYIADTLSGAKAIRTSYFSADGLDLTHPCLNQHLLSMLLRNRAEIIETPVQFFPISPEKVRRTTILDGVQGLLTILWWRFKPRHHIRPMSALDQSWDPERGMAHSPLEPMPPSSSKPTSSAQRAAF